MKERNHKSEVLGLLFVGLMLVAIGGSFFGVTTPEDRVTFYRYVGAVFILLGAASIYRSFKIHKQKPT